VTAINAEASNNWAARGLGYYLAARLLWDAEADMNSILRDFYSKAFGPAADVMERYYVRWYGSSAAVLETADSLPEKAVYFKDGRHHLPALKDAYRDLDAAARLVNDRPQIRARIDHLRMYGHYLLLRYRLEQAKRSGDQERILEAIRNETVFGSRLTRTHVIHTRPLLGKAFLRRFRDFASLLEKVPEAKEAGAGWRRITQPPDPDELEQIWAEDKRALGIP
jgi:hypothetical protein